MGPATAGVVFSHDDGYDSHLQTYHASNTDPRIFDDAVPPATLPGVVESHAAHTPPADEPVCANMNTLVGGALAPISTLPTTRRPSKAGTDLRL